MLNSSHLDLLDTILRLLAATTAGAILGINREWHGQDVGVRTLALVALGSALVAVATVHYAPLNNDPNALGRVVQGVIQGVMTGIGFIGAGSVLRMRGHVRGLTTAATVWVTATLGIACALADWTLVVIGVALTLFVLVALHPLDAWIDKHRKRLPGEPPSSPT